MSVVLLEQLLETFNKKSQRSKFEVYNCILPTGLIEVGVADTVTNISHVKVLATQSPELSHLECVGQGASMIIDCIFTYGLHSIIKEDKERKKLENEKLEEGSGELCENNS